MTTDERLDVRTFERFELELDRSMPIEEALSGLDQDVRQRRRTVPEHDAHPLSTRRPGEVVNETKTGVVGVVDIVDGEQQAVRRRSQPDEFGRGDEQSLVGTATGPGDLLAGKGAVDLLTMMVRKAVEQRRVMSTQVSQRLDHRSERPRSLDRRREPLAHTEAHRGGPRPDRGEQRRLAHARRTADDHGAARPGGHIDQHVVDHCELAVPTDERIVAAGCHIVLREQAVAQRERFLARRDAELASQGAVHAFELA